MKELCAPATLSLIHMRYVPFGTELEGVPNVIVDGVGNDATVLALSHWPGAPTPVELKADTSAEIVLNYLQSPDADSLRGGAEAVSNNHFDIDGLMALWAMLNPEDAVTEADKLVAIAACGDFERWTGEAAAKAVCALHGLERLESSPLHGGLAGISDQHALTAYLYAGMLPFVQTLLDDLDSLEEFWRDEYARVEAGRQLFERDEAGMKEKPEVDLAVFTLPENIHPIAINERTQCSRVVLLIEEFRYLVRYRYESWVEYQSRDIPPRIDLGPFADLLQTFEGNPGYWEADDVASIVPVLRFRNEEDDNAPSSITSGLFVNFLAQYLGDNAENESLLWSPALAKLET